MNLGQKESISGDYLEGEGTFFRTQNVTIHESLSSESYKNFCNISSNEERIKFIFNQGIVHKIKLPEPRFKKSPENALIYKEQGNKLFGKENYEQAARTYSHALIDCPPTEDVLLSTLFANRSAALYHMKEYSKAIQDIDLALSLPYPQNLEYKVQERRARCHLALNDLTRAVEAFKQSMPSLSKSNLETIARQKKESDIAIMIALLTKTLSEGKPRIKKEAKAELPHVPNLTGTKNKKIPTASSLVRIDSGETVGRFAVANSDIEPGDVLVVEKAYCSNLVFGYSKTHCQECFIRVSYPLPCPNCPNVVFCSTKCRTKALNSYHKYECDFLTCLWTSGASIVCNLAVRLITQKGLKYFLHIRPRLEKKISDSENYDPSDYRTVYNLCSHEDKRTHMDFFQRTIMAVVLLKFLQKTGFFKTESSDSLSDEEVYIGGLLLHNLQVLQFNAHEIAELQFDADFPDEIEKAKSQFIGGGLFPTLALFNHSCEPGIVRYFSGSKVIVRSVKPILANSIIAENYGPIYTQVAKDVRKAELKSHYWFDCNCTPCAENWPVFQDMKTDFLPFRCLKSRTCPGVVHVSLNTDEFMFPCPKCAESICIFGSLKGLNDTEDMFTRGERYMRNKSYKEALNVFLKIMKLLDNVLQAPYKDFCLCQQKIRTCMLTLGNVHCSKIKSKK